MLPPIGLLLATASAHVLPGHPQAIVVTDNLQATYVADLKKDPRDTVAGTVVVSPTKDHVGVGITVRITGLRPTGSYWYHIHQQPVPFDGSCYGTEGLFNPYDSHDDPCDANQPSTCGVGDLSGKHGAIQADMHGAFSAAYVDKYLSNQPDTPAFFGNRSVTVHSIDGTRLNCANFELI